VKAASSPDEATFFYGIFMKSTEVFMTFSLVLCYTQTEIGDAEAEIWSRDKEV
jgi:hypothetical protein